MAAVVMTDVGLGIAFLVLTAAAGGHPNFWFWLIVLWGLNGLHALVLTIANSLVMQPLAAVPARARGRSGRCR